MSLLAGGGCRATGWLASADTLASLEAVRALGARVLHRGAEIQIEPPTAPPVSGEIRIDCGNSGTTARLLCGLLAGWLLPGGASVVLTGDDSLSGRPMARVIDPLRRMGALIDELDHGPHLPLRIRGARLAGGEFDLAVASAQVKSALLLAGVAAEVEVTVRGAGGSRDHSERLLRGMGVSVDFDAGGDPVHLFGPFEPKPFDQPVPGDPSSAAFWQVAAALVPDSEVTISGQSLNPGRTGALEVLRRAGVHLTVTETGGQESEPTGDVVVRGGDLQAFRISAPEVPGLIDELPILAVLATQCEGKTQIRGAADLRVKESDRIAAMGSQLRRLGADVEDRVDGWCITGPTPLAAAADLPAFVTGGDHRIAMALTIAGLIAAGETKLDDPDCVAVSYPEFFNDLASLQGRANGTE